MSFLGGAECSTGRNPLAQFTKHVSEDKSLQRDRTTAGRPMGAEAIRSMGAEMNAQDREVSFLMAPANLP
jgi:peroxin-5